MRHRLLVFVCAVLFCAPPATAAEMILASVPGAAIVGRVDDATLDTWAREHLAPHKRPKQYVHVDAIPTNTMGKVRRSRLAEDLGVEPG